VITAQFDVELTARRRVISHGILSSRIYGNQVPISV